MPKPKTRNALLVALALVLAAWWFWPSPEEANDNGGNFDVLANRIWIDHIPTNERDKISVFILFDDPTFGGFSTSSAFEGDWTAFEWSLDKGLKIHMLQADKKHHLKPKIASGAACAPFDHCLTLKGAPRGPKKYGSMEDWVVNGQAEFDVRETIAALLAEAN
tara:strand:- start:57405 stop:57893 length:489 start_codon:yes stop_codon:yes gene_type:complete